MYVLVSPGRLPFLLFLLADCPLSCAHPVAMQGMNYELRMLDELVRDVRSELGHFRFR